MHFRLLTPIAALAFLLGSLLSPAPALAQVEPSAGNALTCALIYSYVGDRGPAYEQLVAKAAQLSQRSISDVRADLAAREQLLIAAVSEGRLDISGYDRLVSITCPDTFGVTPATRGATMQAGTSSGPEPLQCAGIYRWLDVQYPINTWRSTWAGDEMVRRAASATGLNYAEVDRRVGSYSPSTASVGAQLDFAVQCQAAFDVPVPPGAVMAAAQHGDRPGIARGRNHYCTSLSNDFDKDFPDISSVERAISNDPQGAGNRALDIMNGLNWTLGAMGKAQCPAEFVKPRVAAFEELVTRSTNAARQAQQRLQQDESW